MSTILSASSPAPHTIETPGIAGIAVGLKRAWAAYVARRLEEAMLSHLYTMSDRELKDVGLLRSDIVRAATSPNASRPFNHYV